MFKHILVPLDGSARAELAIPVAAHIARVSGASVILLRVASTPAESGVSVVPTRAYVEEAIEADVAEATTYLKTIAESDVLKGIPTETQALFGAIAPTILAAAASLTDGIIVMGSHGYTGFKRWLLGSVADKVVRHSSVPVLVLREHGRMPLLSGEKPLRALVSLDGSELASSVLASAAELIAALASPAQASLHLVRVIDLPHANGRTKSESTIDRDAMEQTRQDAEAYLGQVVERLRGSLTLPITTSVLFDADVASAIIHTAETADEQGTTTCDLIAMATHGRGGFQHWAMGSVTERVLHGARLPLFILRPEIS
jgi:nucleotide-binding universal stress UspA family protein